MNIRHLRIFQTVCEEENITKAAQKLFVTQPAVSNAIHELEQYLGVCLFDRISRKLQLNETGRCFLAKTQQLLMLYDDLEQNTRLLEETAAIQIGSSITIANFILPKAISQFEKEYQNTPVCVTVGNAGSIEAMVMENQVDIALIEGVVYHEELTAVLFSDFELVLICSPQHKLAEMGMTDLHGLLKEKLLLREKGSAIRDTFDSALLLHDKSCIPVWTSVNSQALVQAVKENLGISILPRKIIETELQRGELTEIHVEQLQLRCMNHIVYHKDKYLNAAIRRFMEIVRADAFS